MSAEMYNVSLFEAHPNKKKILNRDEVRQFCQHYNQHSIELDQFLEQFDFNEWVCTGVNIYAPYYEHTKEGKMDCNPAEFLGIMLTSLYEDKFEMRLKKYQKSQNPTGFSFRNIPRFKLSENVYDEMSENFKIISKAKSFNVVEDCPLWVVNVDGFSDYYLSGVVLVPTYFWDQNTLMHESAGYPYTITNRKWYDWDKCIAYRMNRVGKWSPNFLEATISRLKVLGMPYLYDTEKNRLFKMPSSHGKKQAIEYYDLEDGESLKKVDGFDPVGLCIKEDVYHIYTKKGLIKTNKDFEKLEKLDSKTGLMGNTVLQEYKSEGWSLILTNKGIDIQSFKAQKQDKLSAFKVKASDAGSDRLLIHAIDENYLVLLNDKLMVIDADLSMTVHSIKKSFKKELTPWLGKSPIGIAYTNIGINLQGGKPLLFLNNLVISLDENQQPLLMNTKLEALTGEFNFYSAVRDKELGGLWLLAGLERIVFVKDNLEEAFVFNTSEGSIGPGKYSHPWLHLDKDGTLRYALNLAGNVYQITRRELTDKLQTAMSYNIIVR